MIQHQNVYDSSRSVLKKILFAIGNRHIQGLEYLITKTKSPDTETLEYSVPILNYVYDEDFLIAVTLLVRFGLHYHPMTLLQSHPATSNLTLYETHLTELKIHLLDSTYIETSKLLKAIMNPPIVRYDMSNCINYPAMIANYTHTDDQGNAHKIYNFISSIYNLNNQIVKDTFMLIALSRLALYNNKVSIYLSITSSLEGHHGYIADLTEAGRENVYLPLKNLERYQSGILVHEFKHAEVQILFHNQANPYPEADIILQSKYHEAVKNTIISILELIDGYRFLKSVVKTKYGVDEPFNLDYYDFMKAASYTPLPIFKYKSNWNNQKFIDDMYSAYFPAADQDSSPENKLLYIKRLYDNFIEKYHLNDEQLEMLDSVAECITRTPKDIDSEMAVIPAELYAKGLNKITLEPLTLLEEYLSPITSLTISKLQKSLAIQECDAPIMVKTSLIGESEIIIDYNDHQ